MKKTLAALAALTSLSIAAPVFACPNTDHDQQTADKDKDKKAGEAPKTAEQPAPTKDTKVATPPAKDPKTAKKPAAKG